MHFQFFFVFWTFKEVNTNFNALFYLDQWSLSLLKSHDYGAPIKGYVNERRELSQVTFLSHRRVPNVNILHARTVVYPYFQNNRPLKYECGSVKTSQRGKLLTFVSHVWLRTVTYLNSQEKTENRSRNILQEKKLMTWDCLKWCWSEGTLIEIGIMWYH